MACDCCQDTSSVSVASITGQDGIYGGHSSEWKFEASVAAGATSQYFRFNNATLASVTAIYVSDTDSLGLDKDTFLDGFDNSSVYGFVRVWKEYDPTIVWYGTVTGVADNGTYHTLTVTHTNSNGTFTANTNCVISFTPRGATGATGATGASGTAGKGMFLSMAQDAQTPYVEATAQAAYTDIATIMFPGTTNIGTFTAIRGVAWTSNAANAASFRVYDVTNSAIIAEQTSVTSNSTANIISFTTTALGNLTTTQAVWKLQAKNNAAADAARCGSIALY